MARLIRLGGIEVEGREGTWVMIDKIAKHAERKGGTNVSV